MDVNEEVKTEEGNTDEKSLTDLPMTDEQSDSTKGGAAIGAILGGGLGTGAR